MSIDSKLKIIKKIKEAEFFTDILNNATFPTDKKVTVLICGIYVGEMDVSCIPLIDPKYDVQFIEEDVGPFDVLYGEDKKVINITGGYKHKNEHANYTFDSKYVTFNFMNDSFITLDYTNGYKITDCSCKSVIDSYLFRNPYKTFNEETTSMLAVSEF